MTDFLVRTFVKNHQNTADNKVRLAYGNLASVVSILCNVLLCCGKLLAGTVFGSIAVFADGLNNLSDASSNVIGLIGFKLGSAPADSKHPYGHARYEYIATLAVSIMIMVIGIELLKESVDKLLHPEMVAFSWLTVAVLAASILVKLWMSLFNKQLGTAIDSDVLLATAADSRNDVISTGAVLVSLIITTITKWTWVDGLMGLGVACFILYSGFGLVRETLSTLLGEAPEPDLVKHIEDTVMSYPGVMGIHDLMVHDYGPGRRFAVLHLEMPAEVNVLESHDLIDNIEHDFFVHDNLLVTIHYDPIVTTDPHVAELRELMAQAAKGVDPAFTIHDLRIVPGKTHTNVVFDCVVPPENKLPHAEIRERMQAKLSARYPDHICVVKVEYSYTGGEQPAPEGKDE